MVTTTKKTYLPPEFYMTPSPKSPTSYLPPAFKTPTPQPKAPTPKPSRGGGGGGGGGTVSIPEPTMSKAPTVQDIKVGTKTIGGTTFNVYQEKTGKTFLGGFADKTVGGGSDREYVQGKYVPSFSGATISAYTSPFKIGRELGGYEKYDKKLFIRAGQQVFREGDIFGGMGLLVSPLQKFFPKESGEIKTAISWRGTMFGEQNIPFEYKPMTGFERVNQMLSIKPSYGQPLEITQEQFTKPLEKEILGKYETTGKEIFGGYQAKVYSGELGVGEAQKGYETDINKLNVQIQSEWGQKYVPKIETEMREQQMFKSYLGSTKEKAVDVREVGTAIGLATLQLASPVVGGMVLGTGGASQVYQSLGEEDLFKKTIGVTSGALMFGLGVSASVGAVKMSIAKEEAIRMQQQQWDRQIKNAEINFLGTERGKGGISRQDLFGVGKVGKQEFVFDTKAVGKGVGKKFGFIGEQHTIMDIGKGQQQLLGSKFLGTAERFGRGVKPIFEKQGINVGKLTGGKGFKSFSIAEREYLITGRGKTIPSLFTKGFKYSFEGEMTTAKRLSTSQLLGTATRKGGVSYIQAGYPEIKIGKGEITPRFQPKIKGFVFDVSKIKSVVEFVPEGSSLSSNLLQIKPVSRTLSSKTTLGALDSLKTGLKTIPLPKIKTPFTISKNVLAAPLAGFGQATTTKQMSGLVIGVPSRQGYKLLKSQTETQFITPITRQAISEMSPTRQRSYLRGKVFGRELQKQFVGQAQLSPQLTKQGLKTIQLQKQMFQPITPSTFEWGFTQPTGKGFLFAPILGLPLNYFERIKPRQSRGRKYSYMPGLASMGLQGTQFGKYFTAPKIPSGVWTGLITRPIIRRSQKKRKR